MKVTFGMSLDGARWSSAASAVGEVRVGPQGFLSLLETRLGLTAPDLHPVARINQYQQRLAKLDSPKAWFHVSFQSDAWSTARQLLAWRDELIESGWNGQASTSDSPRLMALASIEQLKSLPLSPGRADRLSDVLGGLAVTTSLSLTEVIVLDDRATLPPIWQRVLTSLQSLRVRVTSVPGVASPEAHHNLSRIQSALARPILTGASLAQDDSLLRITAGNEWEAAQAVALWLSAPPRRQQSVAIVCGHKTDVLDQALRAQGLPQLGVSDASPWRAVLQLLPLVIANAWSPVDVERLVELLQLPVTPIPRYAARELLRAMAQEPGTGGRAWQSALQTIAARYQEKQSEKGKTVSQDQALQWTATLDQFLAADRHDPRIGIAEQALKDRCQWIIDGLSWRMDEDPLIIEAVSHAQALQGLAEGKGHLSRVTVERMLDSIIGTGSAAPSRVAQAAPWMCVVDPGQIVDPVDVVIWWGFNDSGVQRYTHWTTTERLSVSRGGGQLEPAHWRRGREASAWRRPVLNAREHCLLVSLDAAEGEVLHPHPVWDEVVNAASSMAGDSLSSPQELIQRTARSLFESANWQLASRKGSLHKATMVPIVEPQPLRSIPKRSVAAPDTQSFSAMNTMLACPMQWVLSRHVRLRTSDSTQLSSGNQMLGILCHRIVEELYTDPGKVWTPAKARKEAERLFDGLAPSMAAELLMDGRAVERQRAKESIAGGITALVARINQLGLRVTAVEAPLQHTFEGSASFKGFVDLLLTDKAGQHYVLDLKWTGHSKYKRAEVENGEALQLASYAWVLSAQHPKISVKTGYFMLAQGELFSAAPELAESVQAPPYRQDNAVWAAGVTSWRARLQELSEGRLEATGLTEALALASGQNDHQKLARETANLNGQLYVAPNCSSCEFSTLCGLRESMK